MNSGIEIPSNEIAALCTRWQVLELALFGSVLRDDFGPESDVIEVVGEAASRVSNRCRESHPEIPWSGIVGMRNRLVHGYFEVNLVRVWDTLQQDMPRLIARLERLVPPASPSSPD